MRWKCGIVWLGGTGDIKIVFALLAKIIVFYIWLPIIEVLKSCLQLAFL